MTVYFADSSALVKRYTSELGSAWIRSLAAPASGNRLIIARTSIIEVSSALARRLREGSLTATEVKDTQRVFHYHLVTRTKLSNWIRAWRMLPARSF